MTVVHNILNDESTTGQSSDVILGELELAA